MQVNLEELKNDIEISKSEIQKIVKELYSKYPNVDISGKIEGFLDFNKKKRDCPAVFLFGNISV